MQPNLFIFVYGTLRKNCATGANKKYLQGAKFIASAKIRGSLFLIDYYPRLCITENPHTRDAKGWVKGEVYLLKDNEQLQQLDNYEGCGLDSPQPHEYLRTLVEVVLSTKQILQTWTYVYRGDIATLKLLPSGDFLHP